MPMGYVKGMGDILSFEEQLEQIDDINMKAFNLTTDISKVLGLDDALKLMFDVLKIISMRKVQIEERM